LIALRHLLKFLIEKKRLKSVLANLRESLLCLYNWNGKKGGSASMSNEKKLDTLHHTALCVKDVKKTVEWYTQRFRCNVEYQDETWAMLAFENVRLAFVVAEQHPPHIAFVGDPAAFGEPTIHRDGTSSVYVKDPNNNNVEVLAPAGEAAPVAKG
jgi:hypothetical protein